MDNSVKKVILLFKTHLDVGFTDYAENVIKSYIENHIPNAINLARKLKSTGRSERFVWTVGSWLIDYYLQNVSDERKNDLIKAINDGDISYHGLPFTMHTETMDSGLFEYGLSIAKKLDKQFNKNTVASKYTDVPGHTKAMIPYMAKAGIRFLHIGVNPASTPPDVPDFFVWKYEGCDIIVMYNKGYYGEATRLPKSDTVVWFAHTNDNCGPQDVEDVYKIYEDVRLIYPEAEIIASDLNSVYYELNKVREFLPVISDEIGDTWVHGAGTDPKKTNGYRALLRRAPLLNIDDKNNMYANLLMVPEHTWGMNEQIYLVDYDNFSKKDLYDNLEETKYKKFVSSWDEQRRYVKKAYDVLSSDSKLKIGNPLNEYKKELPNTSIYEKIDSPYNIKIGNYITNINSDGSIGRTEYKKDIIINDDEKVMTFTYEIFGSDDYERFQSQYLTNRFDWALDDFGKNGCEKVLKKGKQYFGKLKALYRRGNNELLIELETEKESYEEYGCPKKIYTLVTFKENAISFDLSWHKKDANRLAEAIWISFKINHRSCLIRKLGRWIEAKDGVNKGGRALQATDYGVKLEDKILIESMDALLVAPGKMSMLNFDNKPVDYSKGTSFNLYNNIWGTNFPMWYDEDARFRFNMNFL